MNLELWQIVFSGLVVTANALSLAAGYYAWRTKREQIRKEEVDAAIQRIHERVDRLQGREAELRDRVSRTERGLEETPTSKAVHELALSISNMSGELKAVVERLNGMAQLVERQEKVTERLEDYMRDLSTSRRSG